MQNTTTVKKFRMFCDILNVIPFANLMTDRLTVVGIIQEEYLYVKQRSF